MSKKMQDENFPVATLVSKKLRPLVCAYYKAARIADDIADNPQLASAEKLALLDDIERKFYAGLRQETNVNIANEAYELGKIFAKENLDAALYTDLLYAFRKDAKGEKIEVWEQLIDYCRYSAAPVGRFILALHDESPSAYLQAETLCAVLQITNHLQDLRHDMESLQRCYLPADLMQNYDVRCSDIYLDKSSENLQNLINDIANRLRKMLADIWVLPTLVRSWRLKMQIGVMLSLTNSMLKNISMCDLLTDEIRLNGFDWLKALTFGTLQGLLRRRKKAGKIL